MALTVRTNGSAGSNLITAAWWNDYYNLLTGAMQDQEVTIQNNVVLKALGVAPSSAPTASAVTGTGLGIGLYVYVFTFVSADGESTISPTGTVTTTTGNQKTSLTGILVGPTGTTARNVYRTVVGGGTAYKLVAQIADNTTTTYSDTTADGSLGVSAPTNSSFGGALVVKSSTGTVVWKINNDGTIQGNTQVNGTLTVTGNVTLQGALTVSGTVTMNVLQLPIGTIARVAYIAGTGTGANQTITHGLNFVPNAAFITYSGSFGTAPTVVPATNTYTSTQINVNAQNTYAWWGMVIKN